MLGLAGAAGLSAASWALRHRLRPRRATLRHAPAPGPVVAKNGWPEPRAQLTAPALQLPADFGVRRIYIDAGHGAPGNAGNTSCFCVAEQEFTLEAARALAERLTATRGFEVRVSRVGERLVEYRERVDEADRWGADAFVSLHSDVRGQPERWAVAPGDPDRTCPQSLTSPGFSVLWSDEGGAELADRRLALARAVARRMEEAGLLPYGGAEYVGLYGADPEQRGVFVDRHTPDQRIFVLRRPAMPSILIETHHALDAREAERWTEPRTLDAFAAAVAAALSDALAKPAESGQNHRR
jgi:N-acetylmuramoyl-L-alanine amidase